MKKILLTIITMGLLSTITEVNAEVTSNNVAVSAVQGDTLTSKSTGNCSIPGDNAFKNINNTLAKFGYGHPNTIALMYPLQILVKDKSNKNNWLFFDFDPNTGKLIGKGIAIINQMPIASFPPGSSTCSLYTKPVTAVNS